MRRITALEPQKRNKERLNVYLDGEYAFGLSLEAATSLRIGETLTEEQIAALEDEDQIVRARHSAFHYISYRPRSVAEVRQNLREKGFDDVLIEPVIDYLVEHDYLDDLEFARYWVEQRENFKPRSKYALRQELYEKGVDRQLIDKAVASVDEAKAAEHAADQKAYRWADLPYDEFRIKLGQYLQRRGFRYGIVKTTTEKIWKQLTRDDTPTERR